MQFAKGLALPAVPLSLQVAPATRFFTATRPRHVHGMLNVRGKWIAYR